MTTIQASGATTATQTSRPPDIYVVQRGDTLGGIAQRHGVPLAALKDANPEIASQRFIFPGDRLVVPVGGGRAVHVVNRGETLGSIAARSGTSWQTIARANNLANPDLIHPGQRLSIPTAGGPVEHRAPRPGPFAQSAPTRAEPHAAPASPRPAPHAGATVRVEGSTPTGSVLRLSTRDVLDLKKTLQTEWVTSAGDAQAKGIIDTILNRRASGHWGDTVADVVNARKQFSDVNGPVAWNQHGRHSVEEIPAAMVSARVNALVDSYLAERAGGVPSSIGTHLNYANPHYSDAVNLKWINALEGPVLGRGNAIHRHGTVPGLQQFRPQPYSVVLP